MIAATVLALHFIAAGYAFYRRKKEAGLSEGFLALAFIAIIFTVGWTIMTTLTGLVFRPEGFAPWLNRDALTLAFLTIAEALFYYFYLRSETRREKWEKTGGSTST